jgi:uncharacterized membrane protein (DUF106 family)
MNALAQIVVWLNAVGNAVGRLLLSPIAFLPGWLSATVVAVATGLLMLIAYKYTSNQRGIKAARDDIKAHMLALKLFKDNAAVTLHALGRILLGAGKLLVYAIVPVLVMAVPVTMLWAQLALWYQARPLQVGEEAVVTVNLAGDPSSSWPHVSLLPTEALAVTTGPLRVLSKREICWNIQARAAGQHRVVFRVDGKDMDKELAIGDGFMRVSTERPEWSWSEALLNPWEEPCGPDAPVQSIKIDYPRRSSWTCGSDWWVIYWFVVSFVAAFFCRGLLGVNI